MFGLDEMDEECREWLMRIVILMSSMIKCYDNFILVKERLSGE